LRRKDTVERLYAGKEMPMSDEGLLCGLVWQSRAEQTSRLSEKGFVFSPPVGNFRRFPRFFHSRASLEMSDVRRR